MSIDWQQVRRKWCGASVGTLYRHSGVALDICAMLKSLFAAVVILHLLDPSQISQCQDTQVGVNVNWSNSKGIIAPAWLVYQTCRPELSLGHATTFFIIGIVVNQITFATTSILNHTRLGDMMSRETRTIAAYALGMCSFVFGFCKILIIISLSLIADFGFPCPSESPPSEIFTSTICSTKAAFLDCSLCGYPDLPNGCEINDCGSICTYNIPIEIYLLSSTFALTFIYSLFMCDMLLKRPDQGIQSLAERHKQLNQDLLDPIDQMNDNLEEEVHPKAKITQKEDSTYQNTVATSASSQIKERLLIAEEVKDRMARGKRKHSFNMEAISSIPLSQYDMVHLDPLSKKALELAQSLTSQDLLLCMIEADHRKHLTYEMRMRDICYRLLRDLATLAKFVLTMLSVCTILGTPSSIIHCDKNQTLFALGGISPSSIFTHCNPGLSNQQPSFFFAVFGAAVLIVFIFIIQMEKRVLAPEQATHLSILCVTIVLLSFTMQFILMTMIEGSSLSYVCTYDVPAPNWNFVNTSVPQGYVDMTGSCSNSNISLNFGGSSASLPAGFPSWIMCNDICYVSLGKSTYILFASLTLTLVYMFALVVRYHRLAKVMQATQRTLASEMDHLLNEDPTDTRVSSTRDVVLAMLMKD